MNIEITCIDSHLMKDALHSLKNLGISDPECHINWIKTWALKSVIWTTPHQNLLNIDIQNNLLHLTFNKSEFIDPTRAYIFEGF